MKLQDTLIVSSGRDYKPIFSFLKAFLSLDTFAISDEHNNNLEKVVFIDDGCSATTVDAGNIEKYLAKWCQNTWATLSAVSEAIFLMSIEDEPYDGGFHLRIESPTNKSAPYTTLDELPLVDWKDGEEK